MTTVNRERWNSNIRNNRHCYSTIEKLKNMPDHTRRQSNLRLLAC